METTKSESGLAKTHVETVLFLQKIGDAVHDREGEGRGEGRRLFVTASGIPSDKQSSVGTYNFWNTFWSSTQYKNRTQTPMQSTQQEQQASLWKGFPSAATNYRHSCICK